MRLHDHKHQYKIQAKLQLEDTILKDNKAQTYPIPAQN